MGLFAPYSFIQQQAVAAAGPVYSVRTDAYSGSVRLAVPGTKFGNTFGQSDYYSDISATIRGTGSNVNLIASSSGTLLFASTSLQVSSGSYNFATNGGYDTSIFQEDQGSIGAASGTEFPFNTDSFVVETWVYQNERLYPGGAPFHKSVLRGTAYLISCDLTFVSNGSPLLRMRTILSDNQYFSANIASNLNVWYHAAWVRSGNNLYWYWNGQRITGPTATSVSAGAGTTRIYGGDLGANDGAKGNFQDTRVTIGTDRGYTSATITPPDSIVIKS